MIRCLKVRVRFNIEPDDGRFYAYCPDLKGVHVDGDTPEEALQNARDAAEAYIESLIFNNDPLPLCIEEISTRTFFSHVVSSWVGSKRTSRVEELNLSLANAVPA
mgnify:CR=1 FL=1